MMGSSIQHTIREAPYLHASNHEDGGPDEVDLTGLEGSEIRLTPKASSAATAEGTIFYASGDNHVYVGTE